MSDPFETAPSVISETSPPAALREALQNEISVYGIPASRAAETVFVGDTYASGVIDVKWVGGTPKTASQVTSVVPPEQIISNVALTPRNAADEYVHYGDSDMTVVAAVKLAAAAIREREKAESVENGESGAPNTEVRSPVTIALMFYPPDDERSGDYIYGYVEFIQVIKAAVSDVDVAVIAPEDATTEYTARLREAVSGIAEFIKQDAGT